VGSCDAVGSKIRTVKAVGGSKIMVDVPKELADAGWIVAAFTSDAAGKNTPVPTPGASSSPVHGEHSVRLVVPQVTSGGYFLQISSLRPSRQLTTWIVTVQLTQ
jgi:hypothetical protein